MVAGWLGGLLFFFFAFPLAFSVSRFAAVLVLGYLVPGIWVRFLGQGSLLRLPEFY